MQRRAPLHAISLLLPLVACTELHDGFTEPEWGAIQEMSPLPAAPPPDSTNAVEDDPLAAALGQRLFFESSFAGPILVADDGTNGGLGHEGETGKVSCASCHTGPWLIDQRSNPGATSLGAGWLARNSGSLVNVAFYPNHWYENDGLLDSLWGESVVDVEFPPVYNSSRLTLAHSIFDEYRADYEDVFGAMDPAFDPASPDSDRFPPAGTPTSAEWQAMDPADQRHVTTIMANVGKSLHAYMRQLVSRDAPFDRYVEGDTSAISPAAKRGLKLFIGKAGCAECHSGPMLADGEFHNTGMRIEGESDKAMAEGTPADQWPLAGRSAAIDFALGYEFNVDSEHSDDRESGRLKDLRPGMTEELGKWRTKSLRQVAETAPYMRTGQLATLREVVEFYNDGGHDDGFAGEKDELIEELNLSEDEIDDLVAFLETLTGEQVPAALLEDTSNRE